MKNLVKLLVAFGHMGLDVHKESVRIAVRHSMMWGIPMRDLLKEFKEAIQQPEVTEFILRVKSIDKEIAEEIPAIMDPPPVMQEIEEEAASVVVQLKALFPKEEETVH